MASNPLDPNQNIDDIRDSLLIITNIFRDSTNTIIDNIKRINKEQGTISDQYLTKFIGIKNILDRTYTNLHANIGKAIKGEIDREKIQKSIVKIQQDQRLIQGEISIIEQAANVASKEKKKALLDAAQLLQDQVNYLDDIVRLQNRELDQADLFRKKLQPVVGILKGLGKVPLLGDILHTERGIEKATDAAQKGAGIFKIFGTGIKGAFAGFGTALGPISLIVGAFTALVKIAKFFFNAALGADKQVTSLAKSFGIAKSQASGIRDILISMKSTLETQYALTKELMQAQSDLNNISIFSFLSSQKTLDNQIILTRELGLSAEEATKLNMLGTINNQEGYKFTENLADQIVIQQTQNKSFITASKVLKIINGLSGQILSTFRGNNKALVESIVKTEKLGINLEKARSISNGLLDWQSSIESELEAELLLSKELNFERARGLALQGDYAGAAEEILEQVGDFHEFSRLNVIQQQAIAKAAGMSADELADSLLKQTYLSKEMKDQISRFQAAGRDDLARALALGELKGKEKLEAERSLTIQEKFNVAIERAKEVFSDMVNGGTLNKLVDMLTAIVDRFTTAFNLGKDFAKQSEGITKNILENKNIGATEKEFSKKIQGALNVSEFSMKGIGGAVDRFTYGIFGGVQGLKDAEQQIGKQVLSRIEKGESVKNIQELAKLYSEEIENNPYIQKHPDRKKSAIKNFEEFLGTQLPNIKVEDKKEDFIMRGNKVIPFRKDDLIMGGTNLLGEKFTKNETTNITNNNGNDIYNREVVQLLREISVALRKGGDVLIDGQKVGVTLAKNNYQIP